MPRKIANPWSCWRLASHPVSHRRLGTRNVLAECLSISPRSSVSSSSFANTAGLTAVPSGSRWFSCVVRCVLFQADLVRSCVHHPVCFIRKGMVRFTRGLASPSLASPRFLHWTHFGLSKQTLICTSCSELRQSCQVSMPTPARSSCPSGPEQRAAIVCAALVCWALGPARSRRKPGCKCWPCLLEVLEAAAC